MLKPSGRYMQSVTYQGSGPRPSTTCLSNPFSQTAPHILPIKPRIKSYWIFLKLCFRHGPAYLSNLRAQISSETCGIPWYLFFLAIAADFPRAELLGPLCYGFTMWQSGQHPARKFDFRSRSPGPECSEPMQRPRVLLCGTCVWPPNQGVHGSRVHPESRVQVSAGLVYIKCSGVNPTHLGAFYVCFKVCVFVKRFVSCVLKSL
jgi:hypothetical protein